MVRAFACWLGMMATAAWMSAGESGARKFDVPADLAEKSLRVFSVQSGFEVLFSSDAASGVRTNAINGEFLPGEAVKKMLAGTTLYVRDERDGVFRIAASPRPKAPGAALNPGQNDRPSEAKSGARSRDPPPGTSSTAQPNQLQTSPPQHNESPPVKNRNLFSFLAGWLAVGATADAQTALTPPAREELIELNPFTVTSEKDRGYRAANSITATGVGAAIKDVPSNISVVTKEYIEDRGVFDLRDVLKDLPSVSAGSRTEDFKIRGFNAVVQQDGMVGGVVPSFDVNRVELVRGPSSIFYSASRPGGVVNLIHNNAEFQWRSNLTLQLGNYELRRTELGITGPLISERMAFRIYGSTIERGGPYDYQDREETYYRGVLRVKPFKNEVVDFTASFAHYEREWHVMQAAPVTHPAFVAAVKAGTVAPLTPQRNWLNANPLYGQNEPQGTIWATEYAFPHEWYNPDGRADLRDNNVASYSLTVTPARWISLQARFAHSQNWDDIVEFNLFRPFAGNVPGQFLYRVNQTWGKVRGSSSNGRIEGTMRFPIGPTRHQLFFGASREKDGRTTRTLNGPSIVFNPLTDPTPNHRAAVLANNPAGFPALPILGYNVNQSFYATDQIALFQDRVRLLAGARRAEVKQVNGKITRETTPQFGALIRAGDVLSFYGNHGKVFEPNNLRDGLGNPVPPVRGVGAEFGVKADAFDGRLSLTASVYRSDRKNVARVDNSKQMETGIIPYYVLGGLERNEGFELEMIFSPKDNLQTIISYTNSWQHETIENTGDVRNVGVEIDFVPDQQLSLWQIYNFKLDRLKGFSIGGGLRWTKHIRLHPNWDIALYEPGYTKVDLFARYTTKVFGKPVGIQINADNIFSADYYDHVFIRAEPITVSTTLRFQF